MKGTDTIVKVRDLTPGQFKAFKSSADCLIVSGGRGVGRSTTLRFKLNSYLMAILDTKNKKPRYDILVILDSMEEIKRWYEDFEWVSNSKGSSIQRNRSRVVIKDRETIMYIQFYPIGIVSKKKVQGIEYQYLIADINFFQDVDNPDAFAPIFDYLCKQAWMIGDNFSAAMTADAWDRLLAYEPPRFLFRHSNTIESVNLSE